MTRDQFEHADRAASAILGTGEILVIGSQALHASVASDFPKAAQRSVEVDVAVFGDEDGSLAGLIDGSIGEASMYLRDFRPLRPRSVGKNSGPSPGPMSRYCEWIRTPGTAPPEPRCILGLDLTRGRVDAVHDLGSCG